MDPGLILMAALLTKHAIADFALQSDWQVRHKGQYGHRAGLLHAGIHAGLTIACLGALATLTVPVMLAIGAAEGVLHYHQDWAKVQLGRWLAVAPGSRLHWLLFGGDQLGHQLFYVGLVALIPGLAADAAALP